MAEIKVGKNETLDSALRRFKRAMKNRAFSAKRNPKPQENVNPDNGGACRCQLKIS